MEKGKSCSERTIPTVEGGFKIRICGDRGQTEGESGEAKDSKAFKEKGRQ
jgi:hypothetical protein